MRKSVLRCLASVLLVACLACGAGQTPQAARPPIPVDANQNANPVVNPADLPRSPTCSLLSDEDIVAVQGEAPAAAQGTEHHAGALVASQCFYRLNTFEKSISLEVVSPAPGGESKEAAKDYFQQKFRKAEEDAASAAEMERRRQEELERERAAGSVREGGRPKKYKAWKEAVAPPQRVRGLGDEAFWARNQDAGALFVLRKDRAFSVTLSGLEEREVKIRKATELARRILKRLSTEQSRKKARP